MKLFTTLVTDNCAYQPHRGAVKQRFYIVALICPPLILIEEIRAVHGTKHYKERYFSWFFYMFIYMCFKCVALVKFYIFFYIFVLFVNYQPTIICMNMAYRTQVKESICYIFLDSQLVSIHVCGVENFS